MSEQSILEEKLTREAESISDPETKRVQLLIAHLLQFHKREDKPMWWSYYDRLKMNADELADDLECLSGLVRTARAAEILPSPAKSTQYEYKFDITQDTKLGEESKCFVLNDAEARRESDSGAAKLQEATIAQLDRKKGLVTIQCGTKSGEPGSSISLITNDMMESETLAQSILRIAHRWHGNGTLSPALRDLLFRAKPRLTGRASGERLVNSSSVAEATDVIENLDSSALCIQGPPGCGKTHSAAHAIVQLIRNGKRIGVSSNSHKAIENLLDAINKAASANKVSFRGAKIGTGGAKSLPDGLKEFEFFKDGSKFVKSEKFKDFNLIGGTAWLFARPEMQGVLDYLFVDEAGQVSLANAVAMSDSTANIVLLGDQMQLEQPGKGKHPGESANSALGYLLGEQAVIDPTQGIFLNTTHRLNPALCKIISDCVYDSKLTAQAGNEKQVLVVPPGLEHRFAKNAGLIWLPVEHHGNGQSSVEEVRECASLIKDLLACELVDKNSKRTRVRLEDILMVAPYNMQVRVISEEIPGVEAGQRRQISRSGKTDSHPHYVC